MVHFHAALVCARAHPHERDAIAVTRIHVRLDLEHEAAEARLHRLHDACFGGARGRCRRPLDKGIEHFAHTEVAQRGTEENRRELAREIVFLVECMARATHQLNLRLQLIEQIAEQCRRLRAVDALDPHIVRDAAALPLMVDMNGIGVEIVEALEAFAAADRPVDRRGLDAQHGLDLVEQFDRLADFAVQLVDEAENRRIAQATHLHQLDGAILHALGRVDDHQHRIDRGQGAIGIFRKILVTGRVEQVHHPVAVRELHHRGSDRDAALLLHRHPVGGRVTAALARLDRARELDRVAEQQQFFGDRGLARIRVRDDREGAAPGNFLFQCLGIHQSRRRPRLAAMRMRRALRRMKPSASFWL